MKKRIRRPTIQLTIAGIILLIILYLLLSYIDDSQTASAWCGSRVSEYNTTNHYDTTFTTNGKWYCGNYIRDCEKGNNYKTGCKIIGTQTTAEVPNDYLEYYSDVP